MNFAIYCRKSVYSDKSDSVKNQAKMCREYIETRFSGQIGSVDVYTDEGMTGANTDRPQLNAMLESAAAGAVGAVVVYQLDRLSRNVRDFSNIYSELDEKGVKFVSVKESIDTATPMGRAMMYVTMVFAQMERENIAERVSDNMLGLAKKGFWTRGRTPLGYKQKKITVDGKTHVTLEIDKESSEWVKDFFDTFLENNYSISRMHRDFVREGRTTPNGSQFASSTMHKILTTPFFVEATAEMYDYFEGLGCQMDQGSPREKWTGENAVMVYGKKSGKDGHVQPPEHWIVCLGLHKPFIKADIWLEAQKRLSENKFDKVKKHEAPLLKGVIRCSKCGRLMTVKRRNGKDCLVAYYMCSKRFSGGPNACDMTAVKCDKLDSEALGILKSIEASPEKITDYAVSCQMPETPEKGFAYEIAQTTEKIKRLSLTLAEIGGSPAAKHIISQIEAFDLRLEELRKKEAERLKRDEKRKAEKKTLDQKAAEIAALVRGLDGFGKAEKNAIAKRIISGATWDGESLFLRL